MVKTGINHGRNIIFTVEWEGRGSGGEFHLTSNYFSPPHSTFSPLSVGHVFHTVTATDYDSNNNGRVSYSILQVLGGRTTSAGKFNIDATTGALSVAEGLNYEECEEYVIVVKARDNGVKVVRYGKCCLVYVNIFYTFFFIRKCSIRKPGL